MEVIQITFRAITPLCVYIFLGMLFRKLDIVKEKTARDLTMFVFKLPLPMQIFKNIWLADLKTAFNPKVILFTMSMYLLIFGVSFFFVDKYETDNLIKPVMIQGMFKANFTLIATPIVQTLCISTVGIATLMVGFNCIYANILSVFIFCFYCNAKRSFGSILVNIQKNPIIIATELGFIANLLHIDFPAWVQKDIISALGNIATPLALIALGAALKLRSIQTYKKQAYWTVFTKLIIAPIVFIPLAYLIGLRGEALVTVAANACTPIAVNSYSLAVAMGANEELADIVVVLSTIVSLVTMFIIFCILGLTAGFN